MELFAGRRCSQMCKAMSHLHRPFAQICQSHQKRLPHEDICRLVTNEPGLGYIKGELANLAAARPPGPAPIMAILLT